MSNRWTASMSDWTMCPQCCKILDPSGKWVKQTSEKSQIWHLRNEFIYDVCLYCNKSKLSNKMLHFRKNEFISLYNFLPWYALANVLLIVGGIKVGSSNSAFLEWIAFFVGFLVYRWILITELEMEFSFVFFQEIRGLLLIWMVATVSFSSFLPNYVLITIVMN